MIARKIIARELVVAVGLTIAIVATVVLIVLVLAILFPEEQYTGFRFFAAGIGGYYASRFALRLLQRHRRRPR
jgi:hypothetical protein